MNNQREAIAERIRGLRDASDVSEADVAQRTGITIETYRKYETGILDVPMSYITILAAFYHVDPTVILTGSDAHAKAFHLTRKGTGAIIERRNVYQYEALGTRFANRVMEPFIVTVEPSLRDMHLNTHPGQEFNYVISGKLKLSIDGHIVELDPGDSIYFDAMKPHGMQTVGDAPAKFLAVITA
ncbi:MAG: cupin domain-containing protein [Kiritimatiellae bacterium]|nr:cupin domain-containing protein [Kiritimatiellia bacterium]